MYALLSTNGCVLRMRKVRPPGRRLPGARRCDLQKLRRAIAVRGSHVHPRVRPLWRASPYSGQAMQAAIPSSICGSQKKTRTSVRQTTCADRSRPGAEPQQIPVERARRPTDATLFVQEWALLLQKALAIQGTACRSTTTTAHWRDPLGRLCQGNVTHGNEGSITTARAWRG